MSLPIQQAKINVGSIFMPSLVRADTRQTQVQAPKTLSRNFSILSTGLIQEQALSEKERSLGLFSPTPVTRARQSESVSLFQPQSLNQGQLTRQTTRQVQGLIPFHPTPYNPLINVPVTSGIFGFPKMDFNLPPYSQRGSKQRISSLFSGKYNPSLGSVLLRTPSKKVTSQEYEKLSKQRYRGFGLRPSVLIENNPKKKKNLGLF